MGELGVRSDVIERVLNHIETKGMVRVYQRQELLPERKQALALLGDRIELLSRGYKARIIAGRFRTPEQRVLEPAAKGVG